LNVELFRFLLTKFIILIPQISPQQHALTSPNSRIMSRKRDLKPMEDEVPLEAMSNKHDVSLFVVGTSSKKRPFNITLGAPRGG